ncbi:hypothetical protein L3Y34_003234 [Caenorhabditis briggsae]|uniref:DUF38 domain-containing protein n=1 Tax=Caenorhabditis briggsae TaxID=6238 RepID=A0AAE9A8C7_CAEBR|nr:hypothetical protein L3Y34_003234 [Caenorhabditis briggsae]
MSENPSKEAVDSFLRSEFLKMKSIPDTFKTLGSSIAQFKWDKSSGKDVQFSDVTKTISEEQIDFSTKQVMIRFESSLMQHSASRGPGMSDDEPWKTSETQKSDSEPTTQKESDSDDVDVDKNQLVESFNLEYVRKVFNEIGNEYIKKMRDADKSGEGRVMKGSDIKLLLYMRNITDELREGCSTFQLPLKSIVIRFDKDRVNLTGVTLSGNYIDYVYGYDIQQVLVKFKASMTWFQSNETMLESDLLFLLSNANLELLKIETTRNGPNSMMLSTFGSVFAQLKSTISFITTGKLHLAFSDLQEPLYSDQVALERILECMKPEALHQIELTSGVKEEEISLKNVANMDQWKFAKDLIVKNTKMEFLWSAMTCFESLDLYAYGDEEVVPMIQALIKNPPKESLFIVTGQLLNLARIQTRILKAFKGIKVTADQRKFVFQTKLNSNIIVSIGRCDVTVTSTQ